MTRRATTSHPPPTCSPPPTTPPVSASTTSTLTPPAGPSSTAERRRGSNIRPRLLLLLITSILLLEKNVLRFQAKFPILYREMLRSGRCRHFSVWCWVPQRSFSRSSLRISSSTALLECKERIFWTEGGASKVFIRLCLSRRTQDSNGRLLRFLKEKISEG